MAIALAILLAVIVLGISTAFGHPLSNATHPDTWGWVDSGERMRNMASDNPVTENVYHHHRTVIDGRVYDGYWGSRRDPNEDTEEDYQPPPTASPPPPTYDGLEEYGLKLYPGWNMVYLPLIVSGLETVGDLYDFLWYYHDSTLRLGTVREESFTDTGRRFWAVYADETDRGTEADAMLSANVGVVIYLDSYAFPTTFQVLGVPSIDRELPFFDDGIHLWGFSTLPEGVVNVSDFFGLPAFGGRLTSISFSREGEYQLVGRVGDAHDGPITGNQSFIFRVGDVHNSGQ